MNAYPDDGELQLEVAGNIVSGWQNVRVTRGIDRCPSDFDLAVTEKFPGSTAIVPFQAGDVCRVRIGGDLVVTGYVDRLMMSMTATDHTVRLMGRGAAEDVVDSSVDYRLGVINGQTVLGIAAILCAPYGVTVAAPAGPGPLIPQVVINLGETPFQVVERLARYSGFLLYEDATGNLVMAQVGTEKMASGVVQGRNVLEGGVEFALDQRYSQYHAFMLSVDSLSDYEHQGTQDNNEITVVTDEGMTALKRPDGKPRVRNLDVISEQVDQNGLLAKRRANYEKRHRYGRSQAVRVMVDSWRDKAGKLWEPNYRTRVQLPALKLVDVEYVIGEVSYIRDEQGTRAQLTLMPPEAFEPEPTLLTLFDPQITQALAEANRDDRRDRDSYPTPQRSGRRDQG